MEWSRQQKEFFIVVNTKAMIVNETVMIVNGLVRVVQEMELAGRIVSKIE